MYSLFAQTTLAEPDPSTLFKGIFDAFTQKHWGMLAAFAVTLLVWAARKFGGTYLPFLKTKVGGISLAFALSIAGAFSTALLAGEPLSVGLLIDALSKGFIAAGGWSVLKNLMEQASAETPPPAPVTVFPPPAAPK